MYDTIVVGIRACRSRPDLVVANSWLMEYVRYGFHLVMRCHQPGDNWNAQTSAPYFLQIGSPSFNWRVTDEHAEVRVLQPDHPLLNAPNVIGRWSRTCPARTGSSSTSSRRCSRLKWKGRRPCGRRPFRVRLPIGGGVCGGGGCELWDVRGWRDMGCERREGGEML